MVLGLPALIHFVQVPFTVGEFQYLKKTYFLKHTRVSPHGMKLLFRKVKN
ncbi:MAG: hypothetical protein CM15mP73_0030 [Hyphomicrobiales bacterium]|nr:MAG: hypothetical protein CM15mP73_0030 [Hyphomicrobiales bacterium]